MHLTQPVGSKERPVSGCQMNGGPLEWVDVGAQMDVLNHGSWNLHGTAGGGPYGDYRVTVGAKLSGEGPAARFHAMYNIQPANGATPPPIPPNKHNNMSYIDIRRYVTGGLEGILATLTNASLNEGRKGAQLAADQGSDRKEAEHRHTRPTPQGPLVPDDAGLGAVQYCDR
eukprot:gene1571-2095_t